MTSIMPLPPESPRPPHRAARAAHRGRWGRRLAIGLIATGLIGGMATGATLVSMYRNVCGTPCLDLTRLVAEDPPMASVVVDRHGVELARFFVEDRRVVALDQVPRTLRYAVLATEDARFYMHGGVDVWRVAGAIVRNVQKRRMAEGFSTITMQLARATYPEMLPVTEKTLRRKLIEIRVAREIERALTKRQILERYLNTVFLGHGAYGFDAAARRYFGKPVQALTLGEAALLAGLPRAPSRDNPFTNPTRATARRAVVLHRMLVEGLVSRVEAEAAAAEPLRLASRDGGADELEAVDLATVLTAREHDDDPALDSAHVDSVLARAGMRGPAGSRAPYFVEALRQELAKHLGRSLYRGGYRIETTLDLRTQLLAEHELLAQLRAIEGGQFGRVSPGETPLQGAALVLDTRTGDVLALVGGRDYHASPFNRVTQALRQPGSVFKPVTVAAALEAGWRAESPLSDDPIAIDRPDGSVWSPQNFDAQRAGGTLSLAAALAQSRNRAATRLALTVGLDSVIAMGRRLGLTTALPRVPALALGTGEVRMLELVTAYTVLGRADGARVVPRWVTRVTDRRGRVLLRTIPDSVPVLTAEDAARWRRILAGVVDGGTGTGVRSAGFRGPAAGKTGTTSGTTDVWFVGATPQLAAGIWFGYDAPRTILRGTSGTGGRLAAPVWGRLMRALGDSTTGTAWPDPPVPVADSVAGDDSVETPPSGPPPVAEDSVKLCLLRAPDGADAAEGRRAARLIPCRDLEMMPADTTAPATPRR